MRPTLEYNYSLSLTVDEKIKLDILAQDLRESKNSVIRLALRDLYEKEAKKKATERKVSAN